MSSEQGPCRVRYIVSYRQLCPMGQRPQLYVYNYVYAAFIRAVFSRYYRWHLYSHFYWRAYESRYIWEMSKLGGGRKSLYLQEVFSFQVLRSKFVFIAFFPLVPLRFKAVMSFNCCNFINEYLLCFRVSCSLSKIISCWKWVTTRDNRDNKFTAARATIL